MKSSLQLERKSCAVAKVEIRNLKGGFSHRFPDSIITSFVQGLPNEVDSKELVGIAGFLLFILDSEKKSSKYLGKQIEIGGVR